VQPYTTGLLDPPREMMSFSYTFCKVYFSFFLRASIKIPDGRAVILGLSDDVKIAFSLEVLGEIFDKLHSQAMSETSLTTMATENMVYVQPSARVAWISFLNDNPRNSDTLAFRSVASPTVASHNLTSTIPPTKVRPLYRTSVAGK